MESGDKKYVMDAKWKLLDASKNSAKDKYNISQSDVYQLFAYGQKYQSGDGHMMLIYPKHDGFQKPLEPFKFSDNLFLWVVPFDLKQETLIEGDWEQYIQFFDELLSIAQ